MRRTHSLQSGGGIVSQMQLRNTKPTGTHNTTGAGGSGSGKIKSYPVTAASWTADTTLYPDAVALGNVTLYYTDIPHGLGSYDAQVLSYRDAAGVRYFNLAAQVNQDTNGNLSPDDIRIWISSDAAPAVTFWFLLCSP